MTRLLGPLKDVIDIEDVTSEAEPKPTRRVEVELTTDGVFLKVPSLSNIKDWISVALEFYDGQLRVLVWPNDSSDEPAIMPLVDDDGKDL